MTITPPPPPADHCTITLDRMRAELAAQGVRKGPAGALAKAILRLLEVLAALLADFKAGRLAAAERSDGAAATAAVPYARDEAGAEGSTVDAAGAAVVGAAAGAEAVGTEVTPHLPASRAPSSP